MSKPVIHKDAKEIVEKAAAEATRKAEWPEWYTERADGEEAYVQVGSAGTVTVGLMTFGTALFAQESEDGPAIVEKMLSETVKQWPDAWGAIPSVVGSDARKAVIERVPAKYVARICEASKLLAKN